MNEPFTVEKIASFEDSAALRRCLDRLGVDLPIVDEIARPGSSPLGEPIRAGSLMMANRFAIQPMEGWDATPDGRPTEDLLRRWRRFGESGAGLIWGGEAYAVRRDGRANPNQLYYQEHSAADLTLLRETVIAGSRSSAGGPAEPVLGLQLTHSGRFCRPDDKKRLEPQIAYFHPLLNRRFGLPADFPVLSDGDIRAIIAAYVPVAKTAWECGFQFVDIKHCHGYLGHELLSAYTRPGEYGGSFENRTRFLREIVGEIRREAPGLEIGVRLSAFDFLPYKPDPATARPGKPGRGIPDDSPKLRPYCFAFGIDQENPECTYDLTETYRFLELLQELGIFLVNVTGGSPYYNPHIQRPAAYPPSDGYGPPEDPLIGVARQAAVAAALKARYPRLVFVGSAYTYLQEYLPHAAQAAVAQGRVDLVGLGRLTLSYPTLASDVLQHGKLLHPRLLCRTFSDCTTAPRNGLPSGCYPLDDHYKTTANHRTLKVIKQAGRSQ